MFVKTCVSNSTSLSGSNLDRWALLIYKDQPQWVEMKKLIEMIVLLGMLASPVFAESEHWFNLTSYAGQVVVSSRKTPLLFIVLSKPQVRKNVIEALDIAESQNRTCEDQAQTVEQLRVDAPPLLFYVRVVEAAICSDPQYLVNAEHIIERILRNGTSQERLGIGLSSNGFSISQ
jgi:hypothetical protein